MESIIPSIRVLDWTKRKNGTEIMVRHFAYWQWMEHTQRHQAPTIITSRSATDYSLELSAQIFPYLSILVIYFDRKTKLETNIVCITTIHMKTLTQGTLQMCGQEYPSSVVSLISKKREKRDWKKLKEKLMLLSILHIHVHIWGYPQPYTHTWVWIHIPTHAQHTKLSY